MSAWFIAGLFTLPVLVGIYFLRRRYPKKMISSLLLWDFPELRMRKGLQRNRFNSERSFWLEILVLLLLLLLLSNWAPPFFSNHHHRIYLLDSRFSMNAVGLDGEAIMDKIKKEILSEGSGRDLVTIIAADQVPQLLISRSYDKTSIENSLDQWKPQAATFSWQATIAMLSELRDSNTSLIIYSDRDKKQFNAFHPAAIRLRGSALVNYGIVSGFRTYEGKDNKIDVVIKCFRLTGQEPKKTISLNLTMEEKITTHQVSYSAESDSYHFSFVFPRSNHLVKISLEKDSLVSDSEAVFAPIQERILPIRLEVKDPSLSATIQDVLRIFHDIEIVEKGEVVIIADHEISGANKPILYVKMPEDWIGDHSEKIFGSLLKNIDHLLLKDLQVNSILWKDVHHLSVPVVPLIHQEKKIIFGRISSLANETYFWNTDLLGSSFKVLPDWPIFWDNFRRYFKRKVSGLRYTTVFGERANYYVGPQEWLTLETPEKSTLKIYQEKGVLAIPPLLKPGYYRLLNKDGEEVDKYYVNLSDLDAMNLTTGVNKDLESVPLLKKAKERDSRFRSDNTLWLMVITLTALIVYCINLYLDAQKEE